MTSTRRLASRSPSPLTTRIYQRSTHSNRRARSGRRAAAYQAAASARHAQAAHPDRRRARSVDTPPPSAPLDRVPEITAAPPPVRPSPPRCPAFAATSTSCTRFLQVSATTLTFHSRSSRTRRERPGVARSSFRLNGLTAIPNLRCSTSWCRTLLRPSKQPPVWGRSFTTARRSAKTW